LDHSLVSPDRECDASLLSTSEDELAGIRVLLLTTEYPTLGRPGAAAFLVRHVEALCKARVEIEIVHFVSRANPINHFRAWKHMRAQLRSKTYDLVHAHFGHASMIARLQRSVPVVVTYHGSDVMGIVGSNGQYSLKGKFVSLISRVMSLLVDEVIVVSSHLGRRLPRKQYHVVPLGVDLDRFALTPKEQARDRLGWPHDSFIVLFAALDLANPVKRFALAQEAVRQLEGEISVCLKTASSMRPEDIPLYMCAADVLLLTSIHEGSPTVVKEALACNLPVVCTDVGDVRDQLNGVEPSAICVSDPSSLAEGLRRVFACGRRSNGRDKAALLSESLVAERVIRIYRDMLKRRTRPHAAS
jgi:glycosyltransferase involved in cell wall biosynthesis